MAASEKDISTALCNSNSINRSMHITVHACQPRGRDESWTQYTNKQNIN